MIASARGLSFPPIFSYQSSSQYWEQKIVEECLRRLWMSSSSSGFRLIGDSYTVVSDSLAADVAGTSSEKFERIDTYDTSYDSSLLLDYYGTVAYYSVLNNNAYNFYAQFGVSLGIEARHVLKGLDSKRALEALLSVKYYQDYVILSSS